MDCEIIPTDPHTARKLVYVNTARAKQGQLGVTDRQLTEEELELVRKSCDVNSSPGWR
jgi:hypothetical protein